MSEHPSLSLDAIPVLIRECDAIVDRIDLIRIDVKHERHFSFGTWHGRQQMALRVWSGDEYGWGETIASAKEPDLRMETRREPFCRLLGKTLHAAFAEIRTNQDAWKGHNSEIAEMALLDLAGRRLGMLSLDLLDLPGRDPLPGLFCVLEKDLDAVRREIQHSLDQNLKTHLKIKLFGDVQTDLAVTKTARDAFGDGFLSGDVNGGYFRWGTHGEDEHADLDDIAGKLLQLHEAGLDACEDPAHISEQEWIELQKKVDPLALLPDAPTRPATKKKDTLPAGMGKIYNIHPDCTGSFLDGVALARRIQGFGDGTKLMIGDQSLVGPACNSWTQLAIGLGADWVEALEKPHECTDFTDCITHRNVEQKPDGRFGLVANPRPGFGLMVDEDKLAAKAGDIHTMHI